MAVGALTFVSGACPRLPKPALEAAALFDAHTLIERHVTGAEPLPGLAVVIGRRHISSSFSYGHFTARYFVHRVLVIVDLQL